MSSYSLDNLKVGDLVKDFENNGSLGIVTKTGKVIRVVWIDSSVSPEEFEIIKYRADADVVLKFMQEYEALVRGGTTDES
jgi:hypothetical protein